jgi:PadR family transcriptional regulator, regulatory protein PadR
MLAPLLYLHLEYNIQNMKNYQLGEFEEVVILTVGILNNMAYSVSIKIEIEARLARSVSMGALHTALKRLEEKGYLKSFAGEATEERAGRPKRYFEITALGKKAMLHAKETREELWSAIPKTVLQVSGFEFKVSSSVMPYRECALKL